MSLLVSILGILHLHHTTLLNKEPSDGTKHQLTTYEASKHFFSILVMKLHTPFLFELTIHIYSSSHSQLPANQLNRCYLFYTFISSPVVTLLFFVQLKSCCSCPDDILVAGTFSTVLAAMRGISLLAVGTCTIS